MYLWKKVTVLKWFGRGKNWVTVVFKYENEIEYEFTAVAFIKWLIL